MIEETKLSDEQEELNGCHIVRGIPFVIKTYLSKDEAYRQRSLAI